MESWFSGQGDRVFLSESNDILQEVFPASYEEISVKIKYRLKQDSFYHFSKEDWRPRRPEKNSDFQLEEGSDLIRKNRILAEIWLWDEEFSFR